MATLSEIAAYTAQVGRARGYSDAAIAGILGNIVGETINGKGGRDQSFNPKGGGWGAYGLGQHRGSRLEGLAAKAGVTLDPSKRGSRDAIPTIGYKSQIDFMFDELETTHAAAGRAIKSAKTPELAAKAMMEKYSIPSKAEQRSSSATRTGAARGIFDANLAVTEKAASATASAKGKSQSPLGIDLPNLAIDYAHPERGPWSAGLQQNAINSIASIASKFPGRIGITSAYRSKSNPVEARKGQNSQGPHTKGLAFDLDLSKLTDEEKSKAVQTARMSGATRMISYSKTPNMLHVDFVPGFKPNMGTVYAMHDKTAKGNSLSKAPGWFTEGLLSTKGIPVPTPRPDDLTPRGPVRDNPVSKHDAFVAALGKVAQPVTATTALGFAAADKASRDREYERAADEVAAMAVAPTSKAEAKSESKGYNSSGAAGAAGARDMTGVADGLKAAADSIASLSVDSTVGKSAQASAKAEVNSLTADVAPASKAPATPAIDPFGPIGFEFDSLIGDMAKSRAEKAVAAQKESLVAQERQAQQAQQAQEAKKGGMEGFLGGLGAQLDKLGEEVGGWLGGLFGSKDKDKNKDSKEGLFGSVSGFFDGIFGGSNSGSWNSPGNWGDLGMTPGGTSQVTNSTAAPGRGPGDMGWSAGDTTGANHSNGGTGSGKGK